jgi:hypothetical protein
MEKSIDSSESTNRFDLNVGFNKTFYDVLRLTNANKSNAVLIDFKQKVESLIHSCKTSLIEQLIGGDCVTSKLSEKQAQVYYLQDIASFTSLLDGDKSFNLGQVLSDSVYNRYEVNSFLNNEQLNSHRRNKFFLFDDLLSIRLQMAKVFTNANVNTLNNAQKTTLSEYRYCLYRNLIDNAITYKFFQVYLEFQR